MLLDKKIPQKLLNIEKMYESLRYESLLWLSAEMAQTTKHYREVPLDLPWTPVASGDRWGASWSSAWVRSSVVIPKSLHGRPAFLRAKTGAKEALLIIDGQHQGVFDPFHPVRLLTLKAKAGTRHEIALECYAGHTFPGTQPTYGDGLQDDPAQVVEPDSCVYQGIELVAERDDVSAFVFELRTLRQLAEALDENSLRRGKIQQALQDVFARVYAKPSEVDEPVWRAALASARDVMRPLLALRNGPTAPEMGIIGHSHIDTAWLWTVKETWRKVARTFSSVLSLMDQYPEFRFTQSAAYHADIVRRLYPDIFARIQQRVEEGRWEVNGAMWVEPDCNVPSGEAFVRQCLVGQRATREMFGVSSDTLWQPDVFGYSAALPQILQGCDVRFFCTTKIDWNDTNRFPYDTFIWRGIDGSEVLSHFNLIQCIPDPETLTRAWKDVRHKDISDARLFSFGWGDGGGGPTAEMLEMGRLTVDLEGCPKARMQSVSEFMTAIESKRLDLPRWVGELYLELHRGTLTSIATIKRLNRECELALRDAEFIAAMARVTTGAAYPAVELLDAWKTLLVNQFHDILPGSSIAEANDVAIDELGECLATARRLRDCSASAYSQSQSASARTLFNSLSWERSGEFEIAGLPNGVQPAGEGVHAQEIVDIDGNHRLAVAGLTLPPLGALDVGLVPLRKSATHSALRVDGDVVQTPFAWVRMDEQGRIVSFYDRESRRELVKDGGVLNGFVMGEDVPANYDNWDTDRDQRLKMAPAGALLTSEVVQAGALQLRVRQTRRIGAASTLMQDIVFHSTSAQVDFETRVDWKEKYQILKVGFSLDVLVETARHEIQFGHVARTAHDNTSYDRAQFDVCAHKWTDMSENGFGVAFLNNCKYACTVKDSEYRLTLIKSGRHPDPRGDEGIHRFTYSLLPHAGGFTVPAVVRPAYERNIAVIAAAHASGRAALSLASVDTANVIVEAVKQSEAGDALVLRLYEAGKTGTHAKVHFGIPVSTVYETNMLEEKPHELALAGGTVELYFRPFEIKTLVCRLT